MTKRSKRVRPRLPTRLRKFVGRNRVIVTTASLVMAAILLGIVGTTIGMLQARHDAGVARIALADADAARRRASTLAQEKQREAELALDAKREAKTQTAKQLMMRASAERDRGDITLAALLGAEAIRQDSGNTERALNHRRRLAADLRQCPRPTRILFHDSTVLDARFSGDGKWIVTSCDDGTVRIYDAETGDVEQTLKHEHEVTQAAFMLHDTRLVAHELVGTTEENLNDPYKRAKIHVWDWRSAQPIAVTESRERTIGANAHRGAGYSVATGPQERQIMSAVDGQPISPALTTEWPIRRTTTFSSTAMFLIMSEMSQRDATVPGPTRTLAATKAEIWHADTGRRMTLIEKPARRRNRGVGDGQISGIVSPDDRLIALGINGFINIFDVDSGELRQRIDTRNVVTSPNAFGSTFERDVDAVLKAFSPDSRTLMCRQDSRIVLIDVDTGEVLPGIQFHVSPAFTANDAEFSPDSTRILALNGQGHPQIWDARSGQVLSPPLEHDATVRDSGFSPDGRFVKVVSTSGTIRIWDTQTEQAASPMLRHSGSIRKSSFSRDGSHLLVAVGSNVYLWPVGWPEFTQAFIEYPPADQSIFERQIVARISPDGLRLVTVWPSNSDVRTSPLEARAWDSVTGELLHGPQKIAGAASILSGVEPKFSADGRYVLLAQPLSRRFSSSNDSPAASNDHQIWDIETGDVTTVTLDEDETGFR